MKLNLFGALIFATVLTSCNLSSNNQKFENKSQAKFDDFLNTNRQKELSMGNEIQTKEFLKKFDISIVEYLDSNKLFVGWKGTIDKIEISEDDGLTKISCEIKYKPEEYREITFKCFHKIKASELDSDMLYNKIKNISNYSTVYFDGYIPISNKKVIYYTSSDDTNLRVAYPDYLFHLLNISEQKRPDTISNNLKKNIDLVMDLTRTGLKLKDKSISKKEWNQITSTKIKSTNLPTLTKEEKYFFYTFMLCMFQDNIGLTNSEQLY